MSEVWAFLNQKGGVGKSTLSINVAQKMSEDKNVLLVDADPQSSSFKWYLNAKKAKFTCSQMNEVGFDRAVKREKDLRDLIIVDGAPSVSDLTISGIRCADKILIPINPSPFDVWSCIDLIKDIKERDDLLEQKTPVAFIINRDNQSSTFIKDVKNVLAELHEHTGLEVPILDSVIHERVAYRKCKGHHLSVHEWDDNKAISEICSLTTQIINL